ncbi:MAG: hypothetical protein ACLUSM_11255 [Enterococcus avium]
MIDIISTFTTIAAVCISFFFSHRESKERTLILKQQQAAKVYVAPTLKPMNKNNTMIVNASDCPIYEVFVFNVSNKSGDKIRKQLESQQGFAYSPLVLPGKVEFHVQSGGNSTGGEHSVPIVFFKDCNSNGWVRTNKGNLIQVNNYLDEYISVATGGYGPFSVDF